MVDTYITYVRARSFVAPAVEKRYFRLFGDLEYDLLALRVETSVMTLRLREVQRRAVGCIWISADDERQISVTSHELNEHQYAKLERLQSHITAAKSFRYDPEGEQQCLVLFRDIAMAVLGINDEAARRRAQARLDSACDAYARLDVSELIDLHDGVQDLLAIERRESLDPDENALWETKLEEIAAHYPMRFAGLLETPEGIAARTGMLKRKIARAQQRLEIAGMVYTAAIRAMRFRN